MDVDARLWTSRGPHADARLRADARGCDGRVRQELAAGIAPGAGAHGRPCPPLGMGCAIRPLASRPRTMNRSAACEVRPTGAIELPRCAASSPTLAVGLDAVVE